MCVCVRMCACARAGVWLSVCVCVYVYSVFEQVMTDTSNVSSPFNVINLHSLGGATGSSVRTKRRKAI